MNMQISIPAEWVCLVLSCFKFQPPSCVLNIWIRPQEILRRKIISVLLRGEFWHIEIISLDSNYIGILSTITLHFLSSFAKFIKKKIKRNFADTTWTVLGTSSHLPRKWWTRGPANACWRSTYWAPLWPCLERSVAWWKRCYRPFQSTTRWRTPWKSLSRRGKCRKRKRRKRQQWRQPQVDIKLIPLGRPSLWEAPPTAYMLLDLIRRVAGGKWGQHSGLWL